MATRQQKGRHRKPRAATKDILGLNAAERPIPSKWKKAHQRLTVLRDQILSRKIELGKDAVEEQPSFSMHMADAATDNFDRDFALGMLSSEQDALYEIEEALSRIRRGTYGVCELTGKKIEPARLEAIPWARFTATAERQLEKSGEVNHSRLGQRSPVSRVEVPELEEEEAEEQPS
jgi:RNA polymerase-binding transcription factor DksA